MLIYSQVFLSVLHLIGAELRGEVGRLLPVVVHVHTETGRVAHALVADVTLQSALPRVVLVANVHL